ncbi:MAG: hypothetical protein M5U34_35120 [Chloroflexi bacterium]|nr:hypothetical protein [Chloroflexota bacterium]
MGAVAGDAAGRPARRQLRRRLRPPRPEAKLVAGQHLCDLWIGEHGGLQGGLVEVNFSQGGHIVDLFAFGYSDGDVVLLEIGRFPTS